MGLLAQPSLAAARRGKGPGRRGLALPSAMFALVAIAVLLAGIFVFADLNAKTVRNRERASRAVHVAEAGVNHALALMRGSLRMHSFTRILRGSDNVPANGDDSLFINWAGLSLGDQIPLAGQTYQGHTYFVTVRDDTADTDGNRAADMNGRVTVRCRAVTTEGATATVEAIIGAVPMPAVAADGNLSFGNSNVIAGACGGVHANGDLSSVGGGPTLGTQATSTGTTSGNWRLPDGTAAPSLSGQPEVAIPDLNPMNFCAGADYTLLAGGAGILNTATGLLSPAGTAGWTWDPLTSTWVGTGTPTTVPPGTYCAQGNVNLKGAIGSAAAPKSVSVLATGSIKAEGTPFIQPDHPDGILLMAAGDIEVSGNTAGAPNFQGLIYAGAQCEALGNARMFGQLLCANGAQPLGSTELIGPGNAVGGNFQLTFDCSGNAFNKRRVLFWYPRIGT